MLRLPIVCRSIVFLAFGFATGSVMAQGAAKGAESPIKQCSAANRQALVELSTALEAANRRNRLNPMVMSRLHAVEAQVAALRTATARDARTVRDCEQAAQSIAAEAERLARISGPDPQVAECIAANQQAHTDALQALAGLPEAARTAPAAQALATRLADMKPAVAREGQSLADCRQVTTAVAQDRAQVQVLAAASAAPPPDARALEACRAANIDAYGDALRAWRDWASILGVTTGAAEYDAAMLRLRRLRDEVARPGGTLADCETMTRAIAQERARAPRAGGAAAGAPAPASPAPAPAPTPAAATGPVDAATCRTRHANAYNDLVIRYSKMAEAAGLTEPERQRLRPLGERLAALHAALSSENAGAECATIGQEVATLTAALK